MAKTQSPAVGKAIQALKSGKGSAIGRDAAHFLGGARNEAAAARWLCCALGSTARLLTKATVLGLV